MMMIIMIIIIIIQKYFQILTHLKNINCLISIVLNNLIPFPRNIFLIILEECFLSVIIMSLRNGTLCRSSDVVV